jgi:CheY-like chemotaxis protein
MAPGAKMEEQSRSINEFQGIPKPRVVLLVEDEPVVREVTARVLETGGYQVLQCSGPKQALSLAEERPDYIDLLLTDVVMPGMNGVELAEQLLRLYPGLVTVFMSGYTEGHVLRKGPATSAMHIQKPFTVRYLLSQIAKALDDGAGGHTQHNARGRSEVPPKPHRTAVDPREELPSSMLK